MLVVLALAAVLVGLKTWYQLDVRATERAWRRLAMGSDAPVARFDVSMVDDMPDAARRMFLYMIRPGAPLSTVSIVRMQGEIGFGTRAEPGYMNMRAEQILAPPAGFIWRVSAGEGMTRFRGSDGAVMDDSWSRFWLLGTLPVVQAGGNADHLRSAFGRMAGEAVFWTPAALLPGDGIAWQAVDDDTARVSVSAAGLTQTVDVTVDADGRPTQIVLPRWSDANPGKVFREQPFGGTLHDFRWFGGYRVPTRVEAGNLFGSDDYFPFFKANVEDVEFVHGGPLH